MMYFSYSPFFETLFGKYPRSSIYTMHAKFLKKVIAPSSLPL